MRLLLSILLFLQVALVFGQSVQDSVLKRVESDNGSYYYDSPDLIKESSTISGFVHYGWKLLDSVSGDLNGDKYRDYALILELTDSTSLQKLRADGEDFIQVLRILAIVFYDNKTNRYKLIAQDNSLIKSSANSCQQDRFLGFFIDKRVLTIELEDFYFCGSWSVTNYTYKFRYNSKKNDFDLIGWDYSNMDRSNLCSEKYSINFLTRTCIITKESLGEDENNECENDTKKIRFKIKELKTLKQDNWGFDLENLKFD